MKRLPPGRALHPLRSPSSPPLAEPEGESEWLHEVVAVLTRHRVSLLGFAALGLTASVLYTRHVTPLYEASTTLSVEEKQSSLPEIYRSYVTGGEIPTAMEELRSRKLVEEAAKLGGLRLRVLEPRKMPRSRVIVDAQVSADSQAGPFVFWKGADGRFTLADTLGNVVGAPVAPGDRVRLAGAEFTLAPGAAGLPRFTLVVDSPGAVTSAISSMLQIVRQNRDAEVITVVYRDPDPGLAASVPNAIVDRFMAQRQEVRNTQARSTIVFLRQQLDTVSVQLNTAEDALRRYREAHRVVSPAAEASSQVNRLVGMQAQRSTMEAERSALAKLMAESDSAAKASTAGFSYRQLLAFPSLLQNRAASDVLQSLAQVEEQRTALLARRQPRDPDVQALQGRITELESQLRGIASTYLEGLTNQVSSIDSGLRQFGQQLSGIPETELQVARLERKPRVLEDIYTMLQTRLKEAEITEAMRDASIRVIDRAAPPTLPVSPRPLVNFTAGLLGGLILGAFVAFGREYFDKSVHSRKEILAVTGLPVLGLIPRIEQRGGRIALIGQPRKERPFREVLAQESKPPAPTPVSHERSWTFLGPPPAAAAEPEALAPTSRAPTPRTPAPVRAGVRHLTVLGPGGAATEAYGALQTNIAYSRSETPVQVLVFTSALPGEGKTTSTVNFAITLAQRNLRVLLIDADLRRGVIHTVFETAREPGFADVLSARSTFEQAVRTVSVENGGAMDYLTTGALPPNAPGLLESEAVTTLLQQLRQDYDAIIIDAPPVNIITDATLLGISADGIILVARSGWTEQGALEYAMEQLNRVSAPVLGVLLNDIDFRKDALYDRAYQYHQYDRYIDVTGPQ